MATFIAPSSVINTVATHTITAVYGSDNNFLAGTATAFQTAPALRTTTVTSSYNSAVFGQPVTFTAIVNPSGSGAGTPTGTVTFLDNGTPLGNSSTVSGGVATLSFNNLPLAVSATPYTISAIYSGDSNFLSNITAA